MSVRENLAYATEAARPRRPPASACSSAAATAASTSWRRRSTSSASGRVAEERAADLPPGLARLVELGRALCAQPAMLLLDEPSSGLDCRETAALAEHIVDAVRTRGLGVVLIEHDMTMVLGICERLYVLDFGVCIAEGPTAEVAQLPDVRDAYLGTEPWG